ncbi:MAG: EF-hand domain-containing protein [Sphingomicrobium sp.]
MSKYLLGGAVTAALVAIAPVFAQTPAPMPVSPQIQDHMGGNDMHSRVQTRAAVGDHVRKMFARVDANRDGYITKAEGEAMRGQMHQKMAEHKMARAKSGGAMFDRLDANHDGSISRAEFDAAHAQRMARMDSNGDGRPDRRMGAMMGAMGARMSGGMGMGGRMFEMADANRDGRVSMQEATDAALRHFDTADVNRDGQLTPQERMQMHQRMHGERKPG